jgi:hypothetical protein
LLNSAVEAERKANEERIKERDKTLKEIEALEKKYAKDADVETDTANTL